MIVDNEAATRQAELSPAKRALLEKRLRGELKPKPKALAIPRRAPSELPPLSFAQQRLWFFHQLAPDSPLYNISLALRLQGRLDQRALEQSLSAIVARHESLRTRFVRVDDEPVQFIDEAASVPVRAVELNSTSESQCHDAIQQLFQEEAVRPFNLATDLMLRAVLARLGPDDHVLLLTLHHIASDGWSLGLLVRELAAIYGGIVAGRAAMLPGLPIQYADFAVWQRQWMQGEVLEKNLAWWKQQLAGAPTLLDLPADRPRPAVQTFRGRWHWKVFPKPLLAALNALSQKEGVTLFMTLTAAFHALLHRYTGQEDILIGSPIAGRNQIETENLIGFFINTLVLRGNLSGNPTFRELLQRTRETTLGAFAYQELPFEKLVEELHPDRTPSHSPLVQVMFVLQNVPSQSLKLPGLTVTPIPVDKVDTGTAKFDLTLQVDEDAQGMRVAAEYSTDLFDESTIERMLGHFQSLLESIVANPNQRLSDLPLLSAQEREQVLVSWNDSRTAYPRNIPITRIFEEQADTTPDAIAVAFQDQRMTYRELNERVNQLAHHLRKLGVQPDTRVAIFLERSLDMVVALLATLKAGGAYLPLDPVYPRERLAFMLQDGEAPVLLTQKKLRAAAVDLLASVPAREPCSSRGNEALTIEPPTVAFSNGPSNIQRALHRIPSPGGEGKGEGEPPLAKPDSSPKPALVTIDADTQIIARESKSNPPVTANNDHLAYVIYTSGSTGRPKGVSIPRRAILRLLLNTDYVQLDPSDVIAQASNCSFDAATFEVWGALLHGARLEIITKDVVLSPREFVEQIQKSGVTVMFLTTALFNQLACEVPKAFSTLRTLMFGGEAVDPRWVAAVLKNGPPRRLLHVYGPTETTTFATWHLIRRVPDGAKTSPIGRPIANTTLYVLDQHLRPVPIGVPGELYIGGDGLARGYLNQPGLTGEKFIAHPFSSEPGARLYKTGDLVRWLPDGVIEFVGRIDSQVKIRGFRVELTEIEAILNEHPAVRESVVVANTDTSGAKQLAAYFVSDKSTPPSAEELRQHLRRQLPDYMVPASLMPLPSLPLNANGKVNRQALPAPARQSAASANSYVAPRNPTELQLTEIWEYVLGTRPVGVQDKFFDLGGHSLMAVRLVAQIEKLMGQKLPVTTVFQSPTIEQLARIIRQEEPVRAPTCTSILEIQPHGSRPPLFFVHGAGGGMLWGYTNLAHHLGSDQPVYAFKSRGLDGLDEFATIEEMAAHYAADLRAIQPHGPYFIGGYCFGGNVAYEMARVLEAQGEKVALLALLNCAPPNSSYNRIHWTPAFCYRFVKNLGYWISYLLQLPARQVRELLGWKFRSLRKALLSRLAPSASKPDVDEMVDLSSMPEERRGLWEVHVRALMEHLPKPYAGPVTLFRTRGHQFLCSYDPLYGWGEFAAGVDVRIVPGAHEDILAEPHVRLVAGELQRCLSQAQQPAGKSI
ncbi:MAG: amino acid adenylation domain-containing protein [Verrucomicrobiota bacterium]